MSERYAPGTVLDKYRLEEVVGQGGMGIVVAAKHRALRRRVAIKLLAGAGSDGARRRLVREAKAAQSLSSEHVVAVHDVVDDGETPYIVMELLEGENVAELLARRGPLPVSEAIDVILQAASGLADAHQAGVIHRDVKPSNLFLARQPDGGTKVKLLDFGISKTQFEGEAVSDATAASSLLGSPHFMSPEQLRDPSKVDARTDVWSLAVTLFMLLAGERPFEGRTLLEICAAIAADPPPRLRSKVPELPQALEEAIDRALEKRPERRTVSIRRFVEEIAPFAPESALPIVLRLARLREEPAPSPSSLVTTSDVLDPTATDETGGAATDLPVADRAGVSGSRSRRWLRAGATALAMLSLGGVTYAIGTRRASVSTPAVVVVATASAPPVASTAPGEIAPPNLLPVVVPPAKATSPRRVTRPAAVDSAKASASPIVPAKAALDIDGIPIVE